MILLLKIWCTVVILSFLIGAIFEKDRGGHSRNWAELLLIGSLFSTTGSFVFALLFLIWFST